MIDRLDPARVAAAANADPEFTLAARYWNATLSLEAPSRALRIEIADGRVVSCRGEQPGQTATITVAASDTGWAEFLALVPRPFYQDLLGGCVQHHGFTIGGDLLCLSAYYHAVQRLFAVMRGLRANASEGCDGSS
jgi:hypothetical protein